MTTGAQTEARAIALKVAGGVINNDEASYVVRRVTELVATALAAKDAELVARKQVAEHLLERALAAEAQLAEARKALEPFAALADIFDHHGGNRPREGVIAQWSDHRVGDRDITVEHLRAARRAREAQGGE